MKVLPIIFSAPMIRALLAGKKTQTRRVLSPQPSAGVRVSPFSESGLEDGHGRAIKLPWRPGDWLCVRESFARRGEDTDDPVTVYRADPWPTRQSDPLTAIWAEIEWRPSIHMPRWASRLTLRVTDVRAQRVQSISESDAIAEGAPDYSVIDAAHAEAQSRLQWAQRNFAALWDAVNGKKPGRAWADNPWVAAITFDVRHDNIDICLRRDAALSALAKDDAEEIANG